MTTRIKLFSAILLAAVLAAFSSIASAALRSPQVFFSAGALQSFMNANDPFIDVLADQSTLGTFDGVVILLGPEGGLPTLATTWGKLKATYRK